MEFETRAIHEGQEPDPATGAITTPIYQTSTYVQEAVGVHKGYDYARVANPTRTALQECIASLEGAAHGHAFSSGLGAATTLMHLLSPGDHVVAVNDVYGGIYRMFTQVYEPKGYRFTFLTAEEISSGLASHLEEQTRLVWLETPTNPALNVVDIAAASEAAHAVGAQVVVDNVFATPIFQRCLDLGADVVIYSATKHIDGQGRCLGGVVLASEEFIQAHIHTYLRQTGPALSPFNAWVLLKGLETLTVRVERQTATAARLADALAGHAKLKRLVYPGRSDHPQAEIVARQMRAGSTLIAFDLLGGKAAAFRMMNALRLIAISNNLGDAKSLITHPATTTHQRFTPEERTEMGVPDGLVRLSVGLEHVEDLLEDLLQALERA
jgi:O-succinylhomoserine sulfhydrylase